MHRLRSTILLVFAAGCSSSPEGYAALSPELCEAAVVAALEPGATIPETATYSWMRGSFVQVDERYVATEVEDSVCAALEASLRRRGYHRVPDGAGRLAVGYAIAVEGALDDARIDAAYALREPREAAMHHERGALVVDLVDRESGQPLWRGSVAILADPTLPLEVRRARVERGVDALLDRLKSGY
jgi:hypothetical protein